MNKLTKLMLASAVMVTSGFATGDTILGADGDVAELNGLFGDTNYVAKDGGAINVLSNTTIPGGRSITVESGGVGTIADDVVLSNEGVVYMHWDDNAADRGLVTGNGSLNQVIVEGSAKKVTGSFDGQGDAEWYVYDYSVSNGNSGVLYSKTSGIESYWDYDGTWYFKTWFTGETVMSSDINDPIDGGDLVSFSQAYVGTKNGSIVIDNVEKLECVAAGSAALDSDATDLNATALNGKTPKLVSVSANFGFNPPIPSTIANVTLNGGTNLLESPANDAITDDTSLGNYFSEFGVSFKKADKNTNSDMKFVAAKSVIDAIAGGSAAEAVLLNQTTAISVDDTVQTGTSIDIAANLHSINHDGEVTFSGTKGLNLSGNNQLLENMIAECPVQISGTCSMPGNSTFNKGLTIAEDVTTPEGETKVPNGFKVESGKTLIVKGKLIVGTPIGI